MQPAIIDAEVLDHAVSKGDYTAFRFATLPLEESLRKRVGRWVQRYPEFQARIGSGVEIADVVEDVFLLAFENYRDRPKHLTFSAWLEELIDPAIKALKDHPDEELENIALVRSARVAEQRSSVEF